MAELQTISTPFKLQLRRMRYQLLPVVVFAMALFITMGLIKTQQVTVYTIGEVASNRVELVSPQDGTLVMVSQTPVELYDIVLKGQLIARLDDRALMASLEAMKAETRRLEKQVQATAIEYQQQAVDRQFDQGGEARRLAVDIETLRLDLIERRTALQVETIRKDRMDEKLAKLEKLTLAGGESQLIVDDLKLERDVAAATIAGHEQAITELQTQLDAARLRQASLTGEMSDRVYSLLGPIQEAVTAQEARVRELEIQAESLMLRSPLDGKVVAIYAQPGQTLQAGTPIIAVADSQSSHIISYMRERHQTRPNVGMEVLVTTRGSNPVSYQAQVDRIGPQVEQVPEHQLTNPQIGEWGQPMVITLPEDVHLRPGELVNISFK